MCPGELTLVSCKLIPLDGLSRKEWTEWMDVPTVIVSKGGRLPLIVNLNKAQRQSDIHPAMTKRLTVQKCDVKKKDSL